MLLYFFAKTFETYFSEIQINQNTRIFKLDNAFENAFCKMAAILSRPLDVKNNTNLDKQIVLPTFLKHKHYHKIFRR